MPCLLAFGDSNTHGLKPIVRRGDYARHGPQARWPTVCAAALGSEWSLVEEGLPGRTTQFDDPVMGAHMNGRSGLHMALLSHGPIDLLALMLGTNDCKTRFAPTPERVTAGIAGLLDIALSPDIQARHGGLDILLICPPSVEETGVLAGEFWGATAVSRELAAHYSALADARGLKFLDAGWVATVSPIDGVHLEPSAHQALGTAVAESIRR